MYFGEVLYFLMKRICCLNRQGRIRMFFLFLVFPFLISVRTSFVYISVFYANILYCSLRAFVAYISSPIKVRSATERYVRQPNMRKYLNGTELWRISTSFFVLIGQQAKYSRLHCCPLLLALFVSRLNACDCRPLVNFFLFIFSFITDVKIIWEWRVFQQI